MHSQSEYGVKRRLNAVRAGARHGGGDVSQTIYVLEDDPDINRLVGHQLERAGYAVRPYFAIGTIVEDAERARPSLFLLDVMVPGGDGMELCRRLRRHATLSSVPIIFLTARASENDRVRGLELGADDYITKPFGMRELLARVKAVLRRFEQPVGEPTAPVIKFDDVEIDRSAMQLRVKGEAVPTTATEFRSAGVSGAASVAGVHARSVARCSVGRCAFCDAAQRGCLCRAHSREDRGDAGDAAVFEDAARGGIPV